MTEYYKNFYKFNNQSTFESSSFFTFTIEYLNNYPNNKNIIDIGCSNYIDLINFNKNNFNITYITNSIEIYDLLKKHNNDINIIYDNFITYNYNDYDIYYSRFTLQSLTYNDILKFIDNISKQMNEKSLLFIEMISIKNTEYENNDYYEANFKTEIGDYHNITLFKKDYLIKLFNECNLFVEYEEENNGLLIYNEEDPYFIRLVLKKNNVKIDNIQNIEDYKFKISTPVIFNQEIIKKEKVKVLLLTQNFSTGGLENIMLLNIKTQEYDVKISSFENSYIENILSFDSNIMNLISYINTNNISIINLHYILFDISLLKKNTNIKIIMTNHNTYKWFDDNTRLLFSTFNNHIDYFINVSETVRDFNIKYLKNDEKKSIVINNGIEILRDNFINNEIMLKFKGKKIYICVGSIIPDKGQLELVKAFKIFYDYMNNKDIILILLGKPVCVEYLKKINIFINENEIDYIYFEQSSHDNVNTYLYISDTFILPSYIEGCSQAIKEAILRNKKIIISKNVGSNNYLSEKFNNIFLIKNTQNIDNIDNSQEKYFNFLFNQDKSEIIYNIYELLLKSTTHKIIENDNIEDINYKIMNKKIDLVYYDLYRLPS